MATSLKKLAAGIAAAAIAVSGFALGLGTANAANAAGTITLTNTNGDAAAHTYKAYLVAPYNDDYKASSSNAQYVDIDTFGYGTVAQADAVVAALKAAGVDTATTGTVSKDLEKLTTSSATTPWGYTAGTSTATAAERKFADALAASSAFTSGVTPVTLTAGSATSVDPAGLYLVLDTLDNTKSVNPASTQSVPMLVPSTIGAYKGLINAEGETTDIKGDITLKNTTVPVTKQVVETNGTTPDNTPSYNIGDTVKFELTTTIPEYAGYDKDPDLGPNARVLKLIDTFQQNANSKIPFSNPTVESAKIGATALVADTDYTVTPADNGATIDFGKLVNGADGANTTWKTGDVITVVLTATLNKDAFVTDTANASADPKTGCDTNGNCNGVEVEFTNSQKHEESKVKGPDVNVYSFKLGVKKQYKVDQTALKNAQFVISDGTNYLGYDDTNNKWVTVGTTTPKSSPIDTTATFAAAKNKDGVFATDPHGTISFNGLKAGTYTVTEIAAPNGYYQNALPSFTVTIGETYTNDTTNKAETSNSGDDWLTELTYTYDTDAANGLVTATANNSTVTVDNVKSFTELPKTGAAGIALFTVFGVAVLGAAGFFGIRARKAAKQIAQGA